MKLSNLTVFVLSLLVSTSIISYHGVTLGQNQKSTADDTSSIIEALKDKNQSVRQEAVRGLGKIRPVTQKVVSAFIVALGDESKYVRSEAVRVIAHDIGADARDAVPALLKILSDTTEDPMVRYNVPLALSKIGMVSTNVIPVLISIAEDNNDALMIRALAIRAIGNMEPPAEAVSPTLTKLAKEDESKLVQAKAWEALAKINPGNQEAVQWLVEIAEGKLGKNFPVKEGVFSTSFDVVKDALETLVEIGALEKALPVLINTLNGEDRELVFRAIDLLGKIGPAAKPAIPALIKVLRAKSKTQEELAVKIFAIKAISQIDPKSEQAIPAMLDIAIRDPEPKIRQLAAKFLGKTGDKRAIPPLKKAFNEEKTLFQKLWLAGLIVRLGEKDDFYWNFLVEHAKAAIESDMPPPQSPDSQRRSVEVKYSPEFLAWCKRNNVDPNAAAYQYAIELPSAVSALAVTSDPRAVDILLRGLNSENYMLVLSAASGLASLQDKRAIKPIIEAVRRTPGEMARVVAYTLAFFDDPEAQAALEEFIKDKKILAALRKKVKEKGAEGIFDF